MEEEDTRVAMEEEPTTVEVVVEELTMEEVDTRLLLILVEEMEVERDLAVVDSTRSTPRARLVLFSWGIWDSFSGQRSIAADLPRRPGPR